ncbi:MAG: hypothetical protein ACI83W_000548 [Marinoscillum sp.]|jgi:hypothetical protein
MSKITKLTLIAFLFVYGSAFAQINTPQPSPAGSVSSVVGLTDVSIDYFRPKVKGRAIFGEGDSFLQPYGELWRTGANSGSKLTLSTDVKIAGTDVKAGEYLILTIPGKDEWSFIVYSDPSIGGNMSEYAEENAAAIAKVMSTKLASSVEALTFQITDISDDNTSANIEMSWSDVSVKVPMTVDFVSVVMADIAKKTQVDPSNYVQAANFYLSQNKELDKALEWMNMYLAVEGNGKQFWNIHTKAKIQAALGQKKEAIATANKSIELGKANEGGDFGYVKRNEDLIKSLK